MLAEQEKMRVQLEEAVSTRQRLEQIEKEMREVNMARDDAKAEAERWQQEALRPGNKRGCISLTTPASRTSVRPPAGTLGKSPAIIDYKSMVEMHRMEVETIEVNARRKAEQELERMKEKMLSMEKQKEKGRETPRSNLRIRMEEVAVEKVTEHNLPITSASKVTDKEAFIRDNHKTLKLLTKDGLTAICEKEGVKYAGVKQTVEDIIARRVAVAFPEAKKAVVDVSEDLADAGGDSSTS
ncbi:hypothetical protein CBR_g31890 [Chara braunii]|uniref:Uncharacterized protein n=1 Tax=Chara braunii TaxID=69332 RepID=A0A388LFY7_CHABU|nr:hypothetical protein CBR_g31890 [Chara braunii]|eukprot:GBG81218.1 hypothetical protein CBR_g31890 [Chara braunii]